MRWRAYWSLLTSRRMRIHPVKWPMTILGAGCAAMNSVLRPIAAWTQDSRIAATELIEPPTFIIGHWRSGTTLLHELLTLAEDVASPSTLDTFIPNHLPISEFWLRPLVNLLLPRRRPMDNMELAGNSPQEDDFALISLAAPTPYLELAFPNLRRAETIRFDPGQLSPEERARLRQALTYFYQTLTLRRKRKLVLKSPPHTARIAFLAEWFPGARFIHLARHPFRLVPSTAKLWQALDSTQGFQLPAYQPAELRQFIHTCQSKIYMSYLRDRDRLPPHQLLEIKFEELIAQPAVVLEQVLEWLGWPDRERHLQKAADYFAAHQSVRPSSDEISPDLESEITEHWQTYLQLFHYDQRGQTPMKSN